MHIESEEFKAYCRKLLVDDVCAGKLTLRQAQLFYHALFPKPTIWQRMKAWVSHAK